MKKVSAAIDKATQSTVEMTNTVAQIQRAAEETARAAEDVAEQSEAMNKHSRSLMEALSRFTLRHADAVPKKTSLKALRA